MGYGVAVSTALCNISSEFQVNMGREIEKGHQDWNSSGCRASEKSEPKLIEHETNEPSNNVETCLGRKDDFAFPPVSSELLNFIRAFPRSYHNPSHQVHVADTPSRQGGVRMRSMDSLPLFSFCCEIGLRRSAVRDYVVVHLRLCMLSEPSSSLVQLFVSSPSHPDCLSCCLV